MKDIKGEIKETPLPVEGGVKKGVITVVTMATIFKSFGRKNRLYVSNLY